MRDSDEHFRKRNKVMDNEVEMCGYGFKNKDMESDNSYSEKNNSKNLSTQMVKRVIQNCKSNQRVNCLSNQMAKGKIQKVKILNL